MKTASLSSVSRPFFSLCRRILLIGLLLPFFAAAQAQAQTPAEPAEPAEQGRILEAAGAVLDWRDRPEPINHMVEERLTNLLPRLMREADLDMWLVICREYNEDPVFFSLAPEPIFAARRTTMLVFFDRGPEKGLERLTVSRYPLGGLYEAAWEGGNLDEQWTRLAEVIAERNPRRIGINTSAHWPVADGLSAGLHKLLRDSLGADLSKRLVSAEDLVVRWVETRTPQEIEVWAHVVSLARGVIAEAFSDRVITPGVTTVEDVRWYIRERFSGLNLPIWFQPSVNVQREGMDCEQDQPFCGGPGIIRRGDVLHTDVGICYLRLCTDTQEMGYVLRPGEEEVPADLVRALAVGNRWQDLLTDAFQTGRKGNEILAAALAAADAEGINSSVYTHPLGLFGHAPGPTIGMWDNQGETPVRGDWPLYENTGYAIEGNVKVPVEAWGGQNVQIKLEQSALYDGERVLYLAGRQTAWHVVR